MANLPIVPLPARTGVGALAAVSVARASREAARLAGRPECDLDPERIAIAYSSEKWLRIAGSMPPAFAALSGFFRTADGWVRTHGNYPHHAEALRRGLGLSANAERGDAAAALRKLSASQAVDRVTGAGGLCVIVEAEDAAADAALRSEPLVRTVRLGRAPAIPRASAPPQAPLRGTRILDLTRVIAGPIATRTLALLGADVLRVDSPRLPELEWQHLDTGHGKRSCLLDLAGAADRARFDDLLDSADVVVLGYRPTGLDRLGLSPAVLAERRPGLIVSRLSAWGTPQLRGFDSLVQAACGIARIEAVESGPHGAPGALPAQALDHSAGYLLAAETMALLGRRALEGGSWLAETSLRRVAAELLALPRRAEPAAFCPPDPAGHCQHFDLDGRLLTTAAPAIAYDGAPTRFAPPRPWGGDRPLWLPDAGH